MDFKFSLGSEVKDKITGFTGIVRGRSQYLTGCNSYGIQSRELVKETGQPKDWYWVDESLVELIEENKIDVTERPKTGGPVLKHEFPPAR